jgi:hypothetical protein
MSCKDCETAQEMGRVYFFRWDIANIAVIGCGKHVGEIFAVLREAQKKKEGDCEL